MSQYFLLSFAARSLSLAKVWRMGDAEVETVFANIRWEATKGEPVCPHCGGLEIDNDRRPSGSLRFRCKACGGSFSLTSETLFAFHKLRCAPISRPSRSTAMGSRARAQSMLALSRDLDVHYKTAFVLAHKIREAVASEMKGAHVGGEGKVAEVDGAYFGSYGDRSYGDSAFNRRPCKTPFGQAASSRVEARELYDRRLLRFARNDGCF